MFKYVKKQGFSLKRGILASKLVNEYGSVQSKLKIEIYLKQLQPEFFPAKTESSYFMSLEMSKWGPGECQYYLKISIQKTNYFQNLTFKFKIK